MYPRYVLEVLLPPTNGMVISSRPLQPENAESPMLVTLDGISMLVRPLQYQNAQFPMLVTPSEITTLLSEDGTFFELSE